MNGRGEKNPAPGPEKKRRNWRLGAQLYIAFPNFIWSPPINIPSLKDPVRPIWAA